MTAVTTATTHNNQAEEVRIGVYVCHCGLNIAGTIDCKSVAEFAAELPGVVLAKDVRYACSEQGQDEIRKDIVEQKLNRVVVASCTPRLHEPTFRKTCESAGLNKYLFEMANIREHCSWVHLREPEEATKKAKDLVRMAVAKASLLRAETEAEVPIIPKTLIVGGGVAGIQAALDLAEQGFKVFLVERNPSIGGRMAQLDKTFPTMDCSICILAPKMAEAGNHPNIELITYAEVESVSGYIGNFKVKVRKRARYVTSDCTACGECSKVCPVVAPNEFDLGFASRKAIYTPFAQAVPSTYVIDYEICLNKENVMACDKCIRACERNAIDFNMEDEIIELEVGTIIIATGADVYDPGALNDYGYTVYPNVITSLEFERLINAGGPSGGELIRISDRQRPRKVAFIQCIGSRQHTLSLVEGGSGSSSGGGSNIGKPYCSNVCCMNTIKDSLLIREHWPETEIYVFYMDIRAFGKGFEDLYRRAKAEGIVFIRGLPAEIEQTANHNLILRGENTLLHELYELEVDMVILSIGLEPQPDAIKIQRMFNLSTSANGFFLEAHPKLRPVDTPTAGIFLAGCCEAPKDIKDSVTQASASASRCGILMHAGKIKVEAITSEVNPELCKACGRCERVCPFKAIQVDAELNRAVVIEAACGGCGCCSAECPFDAIRMRHFEDEQILAQIEAALAEEPERKILAFCCNWCSYAGADFAGVSRIQYPPSVRIIRTMCSARVAPKFIARAFELGAGAVLVSGCHPGDCHYINANLQTEKRVNKFKRKMEKEGLNPDRLQLGWFSASEGAQFASKIYEMQKLIDNSLKNKK